MKSQAEYALERDVEILRAALTAASSRAEKAEAELNAHVGKQALKEMLRQMLRNAEQKEALTAQVADLRGALETALSVSEQVRNGTAHTLPFTPDDFLAHLHAAISRTPEASLDRVKAKVLRKAYQHICAAREQTVEMNYEFIWSDAAALVSDMADALDPKEAGNEKQ